ncbi:MAG: HNH endonuclease signature motif containing protein [Hydrogenoanaerobacterium sp.]
MPMKPLKPCRHAGCTELTSSTFCTRHMPPLKDVRESASKRGYGYKWAKSRACYLAEHPWCAECAKHNRQTPATEVDHKQPHCGDMKLFWDITNWQPICHSCHSAKTAKENGGFGNAKAKY